MIEHVFGSFNAAVRLAWASIAPGVAFVTGHPEGKLPSECLRVYWMTRGAETARPDVTRSVVQLSIFTPNRNDYLANQRAAALARALGFHLNAANARLCVYEDGDEAKPIGNLELTFMEGEGWVDVGDDSPGLIHLARTVVAIASPLQA